MPTHLFFLNINDLNYITTKLIEKNRRLADFYKNLGLELRANYQTSVISHKG